VDTLLFFLSEAAARLRYPLTGLLLICIAAHFFGKAMAPALMHQMILAGRWICITTFCVFAGGLLLGSVAGALVDRNLYYLVIELAFAAWPVLFLSGIGLVLFTLR